MTGRGDGHPNEMGPQDVAQVRGVPDLAELLRRLRRREAREHGSAPLTYREIAAKTGWSRGIVGEYFAGRVLPPTDRFDELVRLLGATAPEQRWLATARDRVEERRRAAPREVAAPPAQSSQLPAAVPGFVGRVSPLAELDRVLPLPADERPPPVGARSARGPAAVAVISGTAGVGKTSLALHWAHRVAHRFADGNLYLNLRGFDPSGARVTPSDAVRSLLEALGTPPQQVPATFAAQVARYRGLLAERRILLLLDNARDADQVRPLLPGSPSCRVLVTSRDPLAGLVAGDGALPVQLGLLGDEEARDLLAARLTPGRLAAEPAAVREIIESCARLPLALAVVAARAALHPDFSLAALAAELRTARGSLDVFAGPDSATDVRAVLSWSYKALRPEPARLFRLLSVHPGPHAATPALASMSGVTHRVARSTLGELARATLVTECAPGRYTWHDLLAAYASELSATLDSAADRSAATGRLVDHYLRSAAGADRLLDPHRDPIPLPPAREGVVPETFADHDGALAWFVAHEPVLLAAVRMAEAARLDTHLCRLTRALAHFLERHGHWHDWYAVQERALAAATRLADDVEQGHAHRSLGRALVRLRRVDEADDHLRAALDRFHVAGDVVGEARIEFDLTWLAARRADYGLALTHARRALTLFTGAGHRSGQGRAHNNIGWCLGMLDEPGRALTHCRQALTLLDGLDDRFGAADAWDTLALAEQRLGRSDQAATAYERSAVLWRQLGHRHQEATVLTRLGQARLTIGDRAGARDAWLRAVDLLDGLGHVDAERVRALLREARAADAGSRSADRDAPLAASREGVPTGGSTGGWPLPGGSRAGKGPSVRDRRRT